MMAPGLPEPELELELELRLRPALEGSGEEDVMATTDRNVRTRVVSIPECTISCSPKLFSRPSALESISVVSLTKKSW